MKKERKWNNIFRGIGIMVVLMVMAGGATAVTTITDDNIEIDGEDVLVVSSCLNATNILNGTLPEERLVSASSWNDAFGWGSHSLMGYVIGDLTNYFLRTEVDTQSKMETIWNTSLTTDSELLAGLAAQDNCSEIIGCVVDAITDGNTNWNNSYGFITGLSVNTTDDLVQGLDNMYCNITNIKIAAEDDFHAIGGIDAINDSVNGTELDGVFNATGLLRRDGSGSYTTVPDISYHVPSSSNESCDLGCVCYNETFLYVCVNSTTWGRVPLNTTW